MSSVLASFAFSLVFWWSSLVFRLLVFGLSLFWLLLVGRRSAGTNQPQAHRPATHGQHFGHKHVILDLAGAKNEIADGNVGKRHAFALLLERRVFVNLDFLCPIVRPRDGELGFIDGLDLAGDEFLSHVFGLELSSGTAHLHALLEHLGIDHADHGRLHGLAIQRSASKNDVTDFYVLHAAQLPLFHTTSPLAHLNSVLISRL